MLSPFSTFLLPPPTPFHVGNEKVVQERERERESLKNPPPVGWSVDPPPPQVSQPFPPFCNLVVLSISSFYFYGEGVCGKSRAEFDSLSLSLQSWVRRCLFLSPRAFGGLYVPSCYSFVGIGNWQARVLPMTFLKRQLLEFSYCENLLRKGLESTCHIGSEKVLISFF